MGAFFAEDDGRLAESEPERRSVVYLRQMGPRYLPELHPGGPLMKVKEGTHKGVDWSPDTPSPISN
jgi:hypothetical protein